MTSRRVRLVRSAFRARPGPRLPGGNGSCPRREDPGTGIGFLDLNPPYGNGGPAFDLLTYRLGPTRQLIRTASHRTAPHRSGWNPSAPSAAVRADAGLLLPGVPPRGLAPRLPELADGLPTARASGPLRTGPRSWYLRAGAFTTAKPPDL